MSAELSPSATPQHQQVAPTVAFLGPRGTFTEQALQNFLDQGALLAETAFLPKESPHTALEAVRAGEADYACVALESSVDGPVAQTEDALVTGAELQIIRETLVPIEFSILVRPGTTTEQVQTLTTHPVAHAQVRQWAHTHLPHANFVPASSNGAAAEAVAQGRADAAAAPARAGQLYGLEELASAVADVPGAYTRFVLVAPPGQLPPKTGHDRTGVAFTLPNKPASLLDALAELSTRGVDMSRISSRPTRAGMGTYVFHVGLVGHIEDDAVAEALAGLHRSTTSLRFLGSWPRAQESQLPGDHPTPPAGTQPPDYSESRAWVDHLKNAGGRAR